MKRLLSTMVVMGFSVQLSFAGDAETNASAGNGVAAATARYEGDVGFARTQTRSGRVTTAQGVAVGVDEDGLALSLSRAVDTPWGPAIASNFNLSIERDGDVSFSTGRSVAQGAFERTASAGGGATTGRQAIRGTAWSTASGHSDALGRVTAQTHAEQHRAVTRAPRRVIVLHRD